MGVRSLLSPLATGRADPRGSSAVPGPGDRVAEGGPSRRWTGDTSGEDGAPSLVSALPRHGAGREAARVHNLLPNASGRLSKWAVLDAQRALSSLPRQRVCGLDAAHSRVTVGRSDGRVVFAGSRACNLRSCVNCGPRIQAVNRDRIRSSVTKARSEGMSVLFLTLTIRHSQADALADLLAGEAQAWRGLVSGGWWVRFSREFGLAGYVRVVESTYGDHGWHPHVHVLLFVRPLAAEVHDTVEMRRRIVRRWSVLVDAAGYSAGDLGQDLREADERDVDEMAGYFTKQHSADGLAWEMAAAGTKRSAMTLSPDELLVAAALGDEASAARFREYEQATKGRRLIDFSRRLKAELDLVPLGSIDPLIRDEEPVGRDRLVQVSADEWAEAARRPRLLVDLAELVEQGASGPILVGWLAARGIRSTVCVEPSAPPGPLLFADGSPAHDDGAPGDLPY